MKTTTSLRINTIRAKARGITLETLSELPCPTCCNSAYNPFRTFDARGKILSGCVDAHHSDKLVSPSESSRWHSQGEAIRKNELKAITRK